MRPTLIASVVFFVACGSSQPATTAPHDGSTDAPALADVRASDTLTDTPTDLPVTPPSDAGVDGAVSDSPVIDGGGGPVVGAYDSCAGPGASCASGTTCVESLAFIMGPGPRYVCSKTCAAASDCPGYAPDAGIDCLRTPLGAPQCVAHCNHGDIDCMPYGLNCYATNLPDASAMVEFCVP